MHIYLSACNYISFRSHVYVDEVIFLRGEFCVKYFCCGLLISLQEITVSNTYFLATCYL